MRRDNRKADELREIRITRPYTSMPAGSVLIEAGMTRVLCTASIADQVPGWMKGTDAGWVTAEYGMLPGSTGIRKTRDGRNGRVDGRSQEIQRLIGRSLRAVTDLKAFPERAIWLDCDVLQADGGTRTLAITGAWLALYDACKQLEAAGALRNWPLQTQVAAVSVGVVDDKPMLDLCYEEDSSADVDMNIVMTGTGEFVEVQGSAEKNTFGQSRLQELLALADQGIKELLHLQKETIKA